MERAQMSGKAWEQEYLEAHTCPFKKYRGEPWMDVIPKDRDYVRWLLENMEELDDELRDCLQWAVDNLPDRI